MTLFQDALELYLHGLHDELLSKISSSSKINEQRYRQLNRSMDKVLTFLGVETTEGEEAPLPDRSKESESRKIAEPSRERSTGSYRNEKENRESRVSHGEDAGSSSRFSTRKRPNFGDNSDERPERRRRKRFKRTICPFCKKENCEDVIECAMRIPWEERLQIHQREKLCEERTCIKHHTDPCNKNRMLCTFCRGRHHIVWCIAAAKQRSLQQT